MGINAARRVRAQAPRYAGLWLSISLAISVFLVTESASAYTWMIRHGYTGCQVCHADPSGGELLNDYGRLIGDTVLRMQYGDDKSAGENYGPLWGLMDTSETFMVGGGFRNLAILEAGEPDPLTIIPVMQADLYGHLQIDSFRAAGSIGISKVRPGSPHARAAQVTTGQGDQLNLISRTHWLGVDIGDNVVLRGGRLNLPFGLRMPDHTMWVRDATLTDRESDQQHGAAVAFLGDDARGEFMLIAGNYQISPDEFRERGYSAYLEGAPWTNFTLGGSSKVTQAYVDRITFEDATRQAHGLFGRWAPAKPVAILYEADLLFTTDTDMGYVAFAQIDVEIIQGLHAMLTGEVLNEGYKDDLSLPEPPLRAPGFGEPRLGGWLTLDWFFYKQFEFRFDTVVRQESPLTFLGQLHFYL